ncbi:peptidase domain-containing ABC transporter [Siphonobacter sp.]|uniref:peptidase domain-containing ABC transporter n=1 Tax=Siphonobacter sp. TaxID=1869184 RepID=UPI003B3A4CC5
MTIPVLDHTVRKLAELFFPETPTLASINHSASTYEPETLEVFVGDLIEQAFSVNLALVKHEKAENEFWDWKKNSEHPFVFFDQTSKDDMRPIIAGRDLKKGKPYHYAITEHGPELISGEGLTPATNDNGKVLFLTAFPIQPLTSDDAGTDEKPMTPWQRTMQLFRNERRDIYYLYLYAIVSGLIALSLPLGSQAIVGLIQGGLVFSSVYLLAALVIVGTLITGILQIVQVSIVEVLQQRIFAKAAFEFVYRIPRIKVEALNRYYAPELMNRFFDILTVQKALPKILIDITGAVIQIAFGLLLLFAYHPMFIVFGLLTILLIFLVFRFNASKGLETSLYESKYKYKVAQWLEDIARTLFSFKVIGNTNLPVQKMDELVSRYLLYRQKHFKILLRIFYYMVAFKTLVIAALLILGIFLVVDRQITLGQFVASDIIIVLIVSSVEKLITSIDTIFDLVTATEKMGNVTDLPLEREGGLRMPINKQDMALEVHNLSFRYPDGKRPILQNLSFSIKQGERVAITGSNGGGKNTLLTLLSGLMTEYDGSISVNGFSLRDIHLNDFRNAVAKNVSPDEIFDGTIFENITMGRTNVSLDDIRWTLQNLGLTEKIGQLPEGINTEMLAEGQRFSESFKAKITAARCIVERPRLLMFTDFYGLLDREEKLKLIKFVCDKAHPWTFITISHDPEVLAACDRVLILENGKIVSDGPY